MHIHFHQYDLPESFIPNDIVAIDTEAMGLCYHRDRLCLVQLSNGDGHCHLVHFPTADFSKSPRLVSLLTRDDVTKVFHYARFDVGILQYSFGIELKNLFCTKIASRLSRTYTGKHGLKDLCKDLLKIEISKQEQTSDWGAETLSPEQRNYAATDVLHLHKLKEILEGLLKREGRLELAKACFNFLPHRGHLDRLAGDTFDIFSYATN
ncbi:MAG: ribonuclease D [Candidatus Paracaedibacteraceae bacterium]|nr:ribonuclease D [Candidatus Paracaedibacteraceae bacterium]